MKRKIMNNINKVPADRRRQAFAAFTLLITITAIAIVSISFLSFLSIGIMEDSIVTIAENSINGLTSTMEADLADLRMDENHILKMQLAFSPLYILSVFSLYMWDGEISKVLRAVAHK